MFAMKRCVPRKIGFILHLGTVQVTFIFIDFRVCDFAFAFKTQTHPAFRILNAFYFQTDFNLRFCVLNANETFV